MSLVLRTEAEVITIQQWVHKIPYLKKLRVITDHLSGKPRNVREFGRYQEIDQNQERSAKNLVSEKIFC